MHRIRYALLAAIVGTLSACSIHPLPDDVVRISTYDIVRQIRCEARQAVIDSALNWLTLDDKVGARSRAIGAEFKANLRPIHTFNPDLFEPREAKIMRLFWNTGIAYNYALEMEEVNDLSGGLTLLKPFTNGKGTYGFSAGAERHRQNTRTFTVTDTFSKLITHVRDDYCTGRLKDANYMYPIAGKIGMEKVIQDFVVLTLFGNLTKDKDNLKGPPTMVEALVFHTKLTAGATPLLEFTPVGGGLSVTKASLTGTASRRDAHKLTLGLAVDVGSAPMVEDVRGAYFGPLLSATGGRTEQAAAMAVNQFLTTQIFPRTIVISE